MKSYVEEYKKENKASANQPNMKIFLAGAAEAEKFYKPKLEKALRQLQRCNAKVSKKAKTKCNRQFTFEFALLNQSKNSQIVELFNSVKNRTAIGCGLPTEVFDLPCRLRGELSNYQIILAETERSLLKILAVKHKRRKEVNENIKHSNSKDILELFKNRILVGNRGIKIEIPASSYICIELTVEPIGDNS